MKGLLCVMLLASASYAATSYANPGGTGDRRRMIQVKVNVTVVGGNSSQFVDGDLTTDAWFASGGTSGVTYIWFDFGDSSYVIDEAKLYQSNSASHGTWKWQGSSDGSAWTDIGTSFTLGGVATQTQTQLNGNTTDYKHYRLLSTGGSINSSPYLHEMEFKISPLVRRTNGSLTASYANTGGSGDRTAGPVVSITASGSLLSQTGTDTTQLKTQLDGATSGQSAVALTNPSVTNAYVYFDFGSPKVVDEAALYFPADLSATTNNGTVKWQGSANASTWTDITSAYTLTIGDALAGDNSGYPRPVVNFRELNPNRAAYRYLRLLVTSGLATGAQLPQEWEFRVGLPSPAGSFPYIF